MFPLFSCISVLLYVLGITHTHPHQNTTTLTHPPPPPHPKSPTFTSPPPLPFDPLPPHLQDNFAHPNQDWGPVINDPR